MLSNDALDRGRGTLAAGLRSGAYDRAASLAAQQANMNQQASLASGQFNEQALSRQGGAAGDLARIGEAQGADTRSNIGVQNDMGAILRQIAAARAGAPITALDAERGLISGLPLDLFKGSNATGSLDGTTTTTQSGASLGDIMKLVGSGALALGTGGLSAGLSGAMGGLGGKLLGGLAGKSLSNLGAGIYNGGR
jgi:hypothetical protein